MQFHEFSLKYFVGVLKAVALVSTNLKYQSYIVVTFYWDTLYINIAQMI